MNLEIFYDRKFGGLGYQIYGMYNAETLMIIPTAELIIGGYQFYIIDSLDLSNITLSSNPVFIKTEYYWYICETSGPNINIIATSYRVPVSNLNNLLNDPIINVVPMKIPDFSKLPNIERLGYSNKTFEELRNLSREFQAKYQMLPQLLLPEFDEQTLLKIITLKENHLPLSRINEIRFQ